MSDDNFDIEVEGVHPVVCMMDNTNMVTVKNQPDATKYAVLLPQHVSGTNMPIIRSTINP
jgi:hypothetical protein